MILVGTCGFKHRDWARIFYPGSLPAGRWLEYYSRCFRCCEIPCRRLPEPSTFQQLVDGSGGRLRFVVRAPEVLVEKGPCPAEAEQFLSALWPVSEAGLLMGILVTFGPAFGFNRENFARLCDIRATLKRAPMIAEFGCPDWLARTAARHLASRNIALACVDAAKADEDICRSAAPPGYVRLEGRNRSKWLAGDGSAQHDYLYSMDELAAVAAGLRRLEGECGRVLAFTNNIWRGQAAVNARMLQGLVGGTA